jgi:hypothetical protein
MASTKIKIRGTLTGWIPSFHEAPTWKGEASDFRLKVRVIGNDAADLEDVLSTNYQDLCDWYSEKSGKRYFFGEPWETDKEGITVRLCAKPKYEEFPFPVVDGELEPLDTSLELREGSEVIVSCELKSYSPKSPKGGMRIRPRAIQILSAVTAEAVDKGDLDLEDEFGTTEGFKQSKPNVKKKAATVTSEDEDF